MKSRHSTRPLAALAPFVLAACGGSGGSHPATEPAAAPPAPLPIVTVTAPETATVGVPFTIAWTSSRATDCSADFGSETGTQASVSKTESTAGTRIYTVVCSGAGGQVAGTAEVVIILPSAEGLWLGSTADNRALSGVVTREGNYWFVYGAAGDPAVAAGFYTGTGASTAGSFPSANLREFNFQGGSAVAQGTLDAAYTHPAGGYTTASALDGTFVPPSNVNHDYTIVASGSQYYAASGDLDIHYEGSWNDATGEGSLNGVGTIGLYGLSANMTQTFRMLPGGTGKGVLRPASGTTGSCIDTIGGGVCAGLVGNFKGALYNDMVYAGGPNNTTGTATPFTVAPAGATLDWSFLVQTSQSTDPDTGEVSTFYDPYHLDVALTPQSSPPVAAGSFTSNYDPLYEAAPSLPVLAGSYSGSAGLANSTAAGATFALTEQGQATGVAGACNFTATVAVHGSGGNVYDVLSIDFTGGGCVYTGATFNGVARYDPHAQRITLTATNSSRDRGFLFVGTK